MTNYKNKNYKIADDFFGAAGESPPATKEVAGSVFASGQMCVRTAGFGGLEPQLKMTTSYNVHYTKLPLLEMFSN